MGAQQKSNALCGLRDIDRENNVHLLSIQHIAVERHCPHSHACIECFEVLIASLPGDGMNTQRGATWGRDHLRTRL